MRFTKLQALGNDYICVDATRHAPAADLPALARRLTHRRLGVGGDGLLCVFPGGAGRLRMELYNADGSRGAMCGNGIRCLAVFAWTHGLAEPGRALAVETDAGVRTLTPAPGGVRVDMGIPVRWPERELEADGRTWRVTPVSMGNPHAVVFVPEPEAVPLERAGAALEIHPAFPDRTNVEFAVAECPHRLRLRVWERGCGETPACGTGACAVFAAAVAAGLAERRGVVSMPGGTLTLSWPEGGPISLEGPAETVFEGWWPGEE